MRFRAVICLAVLFLLIAGGAHSAAVFQIEHKTSSASTQIGATGSRVNANSHIASPSSGTQFLTTDTITLDGTGSAADSESDIKWYYSDVNVVFPMEGLNIYSLGSGTTIQVQASVIGAGDWKIWLMTSGMYNGNETTDQDSITINIQFDYPPVSVISEPSDGDMFLTTDSISFNSVGTHDDNGQTLTYKWTSSIDGQLSTSPSFSASLSEGDHTITLEVSDGTNDPVSTSITLHIYKPNQPPVITINSPDGINDVADTEFEITWEATDPEDMPLLISLYYDSDNSPGGQTSIASSIANTGSYKWDCSKVPDGDYYIYATVTDQPSLYVFKPQTSDAYSQGTVTISHNKKPSLPGNIHVTDPHSTQPVLTWDESIDPEGKAVEYYISIGPSQYDTDSIVDNAKVLDSQYTVPVTLDFGPDGLSRTYYGEIYAKDADGMKTDTVDFTFTLKNKAPSAPVIEIDPSKPTTKDDLEVKIKEDSMDPDKDPVTYIYQWYVNDYEFTEVTSSIVPSDATTKGETWKCVVTPFDGYTYGPTAEVTVKIQNSLPIPIITKPKDGDKFPVDPKTFAMPEIEFDARASTDADGDTLTMQWDFGDSVGTDAGSYTTYTYDEPGTYTIQLMISDGEDTVFTDVQIEITAPVLEVKDISIISPTNTTMEGKNVTISALVENSGEAPCKSIEFDFYDGDKLIGTVTNSIAASDSKSIKLDWKPEGKGEHRITVSIPLAPDAELSHDVMVSENPELIKTGNTTTTEDTNKNTKEPTMGDKVKDVITNTYFIVGVIALIIIVIFIVAAVKISRKNKLERQKKKEEFEKAQLAKKAEAERKRQAFLIAQQEQARQARALAEARQAELMKPIVEHTLKEMKIKKKPPIVIIKKERPKEVMPGVKKIGEKLVQDVTCHLCGNTYQVDYGEHEAQCPYCGEMNIVTQGGQIKKVKTEQDVGLPPMQFPGKPEEGTTGDGGQGAPSQSNEKSVTCSLCGKHFTAEPNATIAVCPFCGEENKIA